VLITDKAQNLSLVIALLKWRKIRLVFVEKALVHKKGFREALKRSAWDGGCSESTQIRRKKIKVNKTS